MTDPFVRSHSALFNHSAIGMDSIYSVGNVPARVIVERDLSRWGDTINVTSESALLSVQTSQISARPKRGQTFTAAGTNWMVEQVLESDQYVYKCLVTES